MRFRRSGILERILSGVLYERGIIPENLPAAEDVKKVERRLKSEQKIGLGKKK